MQAYISSDKERVAIPLYPDCRSKLIYPDGSLLYSEAFCCVDLRTKETKVKPIRTTDDFREFLDYETLEIPDSLGDIVVRYAEMTLDNSAPHVDRNLAHCAVLDGAAEVAAMSNV